MVDGEAEPHKNVGVSFVDFSAGQDSTIMLLAATFLFIGIGNWLVSSTKISSEIKVGTAFYLPHPDGVILNGMCVIGNNVSIYQQVTIGEWWGEAPHIKDGTSIFGGSKIFGDITIGKNCLLEIFSFRINFPNTITKYQARVADIITTLNSVKTNMGYAYPSPCIIRVLVIPMVMKG